MTKSTIIKALSDWFADCKVLSGDNSPNVEYLDDEAQSCTIEVVPCDPVISRYADGSSKRQYLFIFASREFYGNDKNMNIESLEFYERLEEWIAEQNVNEHLPKLPEGCSPQRVQVISSGYAMDNDTKTARYQIQCRLTYIKEA